VIFEWDTTFFNTYLPLNAEVNLVTRSTGLADLTRVRITESIQMLIDGGPLAEDWMFEDPVVISVVDTNFLTVNMTEADSFITTVEDGPFAGFQMGYDNVPYDDVELYDAGTPPDIYSLLANSSLTAQQTQDILDQWNNFLLDGQVPTTAAQWAFYHAAVAGDPNPGLTAATGFGFPLVGAAFDITERSSGSAAASIVESMVIQAVDSGSTFDAFGMDSAPLDSLPDTMAIIIAGDPTTMSFPATYEVDVPARVFELSFSKAPTGTLSYTIQLPSGISYPISPQMISARQFTVSLASPSTVKITVA
jgi:hypothetical protein